MQNFIKKTGLFLQVRLNSNRMPGKAMISLCGRSIVEQAMDRLNFVPADERIILTNPESEYYLKPIAEKNGWKIFLGDTQNVLKRFIKTIQYYNINTIIRATADNPLVSSEIALQTLELYNKENCDLAYLAPVPLGSGIEVISARALITAYEKTNIPYHLEHVTPFIYEHKELFKIRSGKFHDTNVSRSNIRLTIDTNEDFEKMNYLFRNLDMKNKNMKIESIIKTYNSLDFKSKFRRILFITAFSESYGMGHLKRINYLAEKLKDDFILYYTLKFGDIKKLQKVDTNNFNFIDFNKIDEIIVKEGIFERVIVDLRDTTIEEMEKYKSFGPVISFDDMGNGGQISDINIQTLPILNEYNKLIFNYSGLEYLFTKIKKEKRVKILSKSPRNILVTFGGSDPNSLTLPVANSLDMLGYNVTVIIGPYFKSNINKIGNCKILLNIIKLDDYIKNADLVITSFGITFFESILMEKPVLIINPSDYHDRLTADFEYQYFIKRTPEILNEDYIKNNIREMINKMINENAFGKEDNDGMIKYYNLKIGNKSNDIVNLIKNITPVISICPYCCTKNDTKINRTKEYNMIKCKKCNLIYLNYFINKNKEYNKNYFIDEYQKTYGKTYEEDKENIIELAKRRVKIINTYIKEGILLDFGSGLGFFAEYCESMGFKTLSIDISKYATDFIKNKLNMQSLCNDHKYFEKTDSLFDVITSFFVIEHIKDFQKLIFLFSTHLKKNGLIVLSTPNSKGISFRRNFKNFIKNYPDDHIVMFSPKFLKNLLKKNGYSNIKIVITGIHPERFISSKFLLKNKFVCKLIGYYAGLFQLGDTFEIYAQKI